MINLDEDASMNQVIKDEGIVLYLSLKPRSDQDDIFILRGVNNGFTSIDPKSCGGHKSHSTPNSPSKKESPRRLKRSSSASDPIMRSPEIKCFHDHYRSSSQSKITRRLKCSHFRYNFIMHRHSSWQIN